MNSITLNSLTLSARIGQTYGDIDTSELKNNSELKGKNLAEKYKVIFFDDEAAMNALNITDLVLGTDRDLYIKITASLNDKNWAGTTQISRMLLKVQKNNLKEVNLNNADLIANVGQTYGDIDTSVLKNNPALKGKSLADNYTVKFFGDTKLEKKLTDHDQGTNIDAYVKVTASQADQNWTGTTQISQMELIIKKNLKDVTLAKVDLRVKWLQTFADIDTTNIRNNLALGEKSLHQGYITEYYWKINKDFKEIPYWTRAWKRGVTAIYVKVTASSDDENWTGTTNYLEMNVIVS